MLPEMRAAADKFILDVANVKYIAAAAGRRGLEQKAPGSEWNVRQTLGHLAFALERYADLLPRLAHEDPLGPVDLDNGEDARRAMKRGLPDILDSMSAARDRVIEALLSIDEQTLDREVLDGRKVSEIVAAFARHFETHAIDFADALPKLRMDPMLLNWVLYADYRNRPDALERQQRLAAEVREALQEGDE